MEPNLVDDPAAWSRFDWRAAWADLDGVPGGGVNIAHECVDRHVAAGRGGRIALRWLGRRGDRTDVTFATLAESTSRFANVLASLGVERGDRVVILMGRIPALHTAVLGTLKHRAVACTLFSAFGPEPIRQRIEIGRATVLVTTAALYRRKVAPIRGALASLRHVLLVGGTDGIDGGDGGGDGVVDLGMLMDRADPRYEIAPTDPEDPALVHFTSGTTGTPKGALHAHQAVVAHRATARWALDLHDDDVYWCTADPGWVTGTSYGIIAPLALGVTSVVDEAEFDADRWYAILRDERVSVWYTAPTAVRMMMRAGVDVADRGPLPDLRFIASVGEPLNPEAIRWSRAALGLPIHDNWWQTETGGIMIANIAAAEIRPGSMGRPLPGIIAAILRRDADGNVVVRDGDAEVVTEPLVEGELALRPGWPSMFRGYLDDEERTSRCFAGGWYLTGDLATRDADGYIWFVGRGDDVIKSAGHLIGPFEVESALLEHPAVAEAGVAGKPDPVVGQVVTAAVLLARGFEPSEALRQDLVAHARRRLGAAVAPREITFTDRLPKTRSGKIVRRMLRDGGNGQPDTSMMEDD